jgi:hypothetical protein
MPRYAYVCPGAVSLAFMPVPASDGRGCGPWQTAGNVEGQPGTRAVPVGLPDFGTTGQVVNGATVRGAGGGYSQGSGTMPLAWYPSQYYLRRLDGATFTVPGQGLAVWSDNQMPVPAADPVGRAAVLARPPVFVGQQPAAKGPGFFARLAQKTGYTGPGAYGG